MSVDYSKRITKGSLNQRLKKKEIATVTLNEADRWKQASDGAHRETVTVQPVHSPLSIPTKEFYDNWDQIDWGRN